MTLLQAAIQVTFLIAMPVEQFYGADLVSNLALLLSIPSSRIKVVDVRAGSTEVDISIADQNATVTNATSSNATLVKEMQDSQTLRLLQLTVQLQGLATSGALSSALGVPVLSMSVQPLPYNLTSTGAPPSGAPLGTVTAVFNATSNSTSGGAVLPSSSSGGGGSSAAGLTTGAIVGIAVGSAVAVLLVAVLVVVIRRARAPPKDPVFMTTNKASRGSFEAYAAGDPVKSACSLLPVCLPRARSN